MYIEDKAQGEPSIAGLLKFAESKEPDEKYEWSNQYECACGQYSQSIGRLADWFERGHDSVWGRLNTLAAPSSIMSSSPSTTTFGGLAKVLRKELEPA